MKIIITLGLLLCSVYTGAQPAPSLLKSIPVKAGKLEVDELGNAYVLRRDNTLIKYDAKGDSIANYASLSNGDVGLLDVTNPLRVVLYYPRYAKLVLLDRLLAPKNELNLRKINMLNSNVIATSADGNLWVYDQFNATLNKLDMELNVMIRGNDLRQQLSELPHSQYLIERDRKVYMADTVQGILVFDQYGNYINTLSLYGIKRMQVVDQQLIYMKDPHELLAYDISRMEETHIAIPGYEGRTPLQAAYCRNILYVLYPDMLVLYRTGN